MMKKSIYNILLIAVFIIFLIFFISLVLFTSPNADSKMSIDTKTPVKELKVAGFFIEFEDGVSESEIKTILESYNFTMNYSIKYKTHYVEDKYYIILDKDNWDIRREISKGMKEKKKDWITSSPAHVIRKGDDYVFTVSEQAVQDENFLAILKKHNIQVNKFVECLVRFEKPDGSRYWIPEEDAIRIKNQLEKNETIFSVSIDYIYDQ